ncbi:MAG: cell division protein FtsA [Parcubacteria group bacterium]|jgi:cell division protein FtsA
MSNKDNIIISLDVGSNNIRAAAAQINNEEEIQILGVAISKSRGIRRGAVIDVEDASKSISEVINKLETIIDCRVHDIVLGIGGTDIKLQKTKGVIAIGRANGTVEEEDIQRVLEAAKNASMPINSEIIHSIAKSYKLDDQSEIRNPLGLKGIRLEADVLMIEDASTHLGNLTKSVGHYVNIDELAVNSVAASAVVLDKSQKELGVAIVDIGGGTTSITIYEEGELSYLTVLPVGAGHITNDLAIGLRTSIEVAEKIKLEYGSAFPKEINKRDIIELSEIDIKEEGVVLRYHVAEIIEARLREIFEMINNELKKIGKAGLLPAGVVLIGGGSELPGVVSFAKDILGLPAKTGYPTEVTGVLDKIDSPSFSTVIGLLASSYQNACKNKNHNKYMNFFSTDKINMKKIGGRIKKWTDNFLP